MTTRGLPEVPIRIDPAHPQFRRLLVEMRQALIDMQPSRQPLGPPTNFKVTAQAFGALLQWTRATTADYYEVLWNTVPDPTRAQSIDAGNSSQYVDVIGQTGIVRYYWLRSVRNTGQKSNLTGPIKITTLAAGTGVNPPVPPPIAQQITTDLAGHQVPLNPKKPQGG